MWTNWFATQISGTAVACQVRWWVQPINCIFFQSVTISFTRSSADFFLLLIVRIRRTKLPFQAFRLHWMERTTCTRKPSTFSRIFFRTRRVSANLPKRRRDVYWRCWGYSTADYQHWIGLCMPGQTRFTCLWLGYWQRTAEFERRQVDIFLIDYGTNTFHVKNWCLEWVK